MYIYTYIHFLLIGATRALCTDIPVQPVRVKTYANLVSANIHMGFLL